MLNLHVEYTTEFVNKDSYIRFFNEWRYMLHRSVNKKCIQHFSQHDSKMLDETLGWFVVTYKDKKNENRKFLVCLAFMSSVYCCVL